MYTNRRGWGLASTGAVAAGAVPFSVTADPSGRFAYVANDVFWQRLRVLYQRHDWELASIEAVALGTAPASVTVDPSSHFAYVANEGLNNLSMYT